MSLQRKLSTFTGPKRSLGEVVVNGQKDVKFCGSAENRVDAAKFAAKHVLNPF